MIKLQKQMTSPVSEHLVPVKQEEYRLESEGGVFYLYIYPELKLSERMILC